MNFANGFNLTASVIPVVTFGRVKQPARPLHEDISSDSERRLILERI
jgi:hypothetical protein